MESCPSRSDPVTQDRGLFPDLSIQATISVGAIPWRSCHSSYEKWSEKGRRTVHALQKANAYSNGEPGITQVMSANSVAKQYNAADSMRILIIVA